MECFVKFEHKWFKRISVKLTNEEKVVLEDFSSKNEENRKRIWQQIHSRSFCCADLEECYECESVYKKHFKENSELVSINVILPSKHGCLVYKINEEHKKINF